LIRGSSPGSKRELDMAVKLIGEMSDTWDPASYHDTF
jgi:DNA end-binding protein Ku